MEYCSITQYIRSNDSLDAKIAAVEALIEAMLLGSVETVENSGTMSISLDDGHMKVSTQYTSSSDMTNGIFALERLLQKYINQRNGSITVLRSRLNR